MDKCSLNKLCRFCIIVSLVLLSNPFVVLSLNDSSRTTNLQIGAEAYYFYRTKKLDLWSLAVGPTVLYQTSERFSFQLSFCMDLSRYTVYERGALVPGSTNTYYAIIKDKANYFVPLMFNFNFFKYNNLRSFFNVGGGLGGHYYSDENYNTVKTSGLYTIMGLGVNYQWNKFLVSRLLVNARYVDKMIFPGLVFDIVAPIKLNKNK